MRMAPALTGALITATLLGLGLPDAWADATPPRGPVAPAAGAWLGAYVNHDDPPDEAAREAEIAALEADLGRRLDIDHHYQPFWEPGGMVGELERWDIESGRIPMISWHAVATDSVAGGEWDGEVAAQAQVVRDVGVPVLIRWGWEMDMTSRWWVSTPQSYIAAWRRLHDIFRANGADNAVWVWCPTAMGFSNGTAPTYYPGDDYVDWICADGYNWAPGRPGAAWRPLARIFADFYAWAAPRGKPLMIGETGAQERLEGEKAEWIAEANQTLQRDFPAVKALVYFDSSARYDWRVTTSASAFEAFEALAHDPYWNQPRVPVQSPAPPAQPPVAERVTVGRIAGADRVATAVAISQRQFPQRAGSVYLARADVFADAVTAGTVTDGPILLVPSCGPVPDPVRAEIAALAPARVVALGGHAAVCDATLSAAAQGRPTVRLAGGSRLGTAVAVARDQFQHGAETVYLARADEPADAVAAGSLTGGPMLLVPSCGQLPQELADELDRLAAAETVALGGQAAVCDQLLADAARGGRTARLAGASRFETAVAIARRAFPTAEEVYLARADLPADAIVGGVLTGGPTLLVAPCGPQAPSVVDYVASAGVRTVTALGGRSAVCDTTRDALAAVA